MKNEHSPCVTAQAAMCAHSVESPSLSLFLCLRSVSRMFYDENSGKLKAV